MASREMKRLLNTHGFEVAKRSTNATRNTDEITTRNMVARAEVMTKDTAKEHSKPKKKNPYFGASGPFARKHKWTAKKKRKVPPALDLETKPEANPEPATPLRAPPYKSTD